MAQDRKAVALSDISVFGNPLLLKNLQNARRNECASSPAVSLRCTALVDEQVNKHMYAAERVQDQQSLFQCARRMNLLRQECLASLVNFL